jgi:hypothetical protein
MTTEPTRAEQAAFDRFGDNAPLIRPLIQNVIEAVTPVIADETALQIGRDLLEDGIEAVLHRLVGEKHAAFVLNLVRAEAVEDAARAKFGLTLTAHGSIRQDLYDYAKELRAAPLPGSPLADPEGGVR